MDSKTTEIKAIMAERLSAYDQNQRVIERDMTHLNELRQEVTNDRGLFVTVKAYDTFRDSVNLSVSRIERILPIVALLSAAAGAAGAGLVVKLLGG